MGYIEDLRAVIGKMPVNLCGSVVLLTDKRGRLLLQQRVYPPGRWGIPGGLMELGESAEDCARRELLEETGVRLGSLRLLGVYSGEGHRTVAKNGDIFHTVVVAYACDDFAGEPRVSDGESLALRWFDPGELPDDIAKSHRKVLRDWLALTGGKEAT